MHYNNFPGHINVEKTFEQCFQPLPLTKKLEKLLKYDRYLGAGWDGKQVDDENGLEETI